MAENRPRGAYPNLLDPQSIGGRLPWKHVGQKLAQQLQVQAGGMAAHNMEMPPLSVVLQGRERPYPPALARYPKGWNEIFGQIMHTLDGVQRQHYTGVSEAIVVIDKGQEPTTKQRYILDSLIEPAEDGLLPVRVRLLEVARATTHPQALNIGKEAALNPPSGVQVPEVVAITEKGARYATDQAFRTFAAGVGRGFAGVYGTRLADGRAKLAESVLYSGSALKYVTLTTPGDSKQTVGFMAADRVGYSAHFISQHDFPEEYERGGSDGQLGAEADGFYHPAASIQMADGLGPTMLAAQLLEWRQYGAPNEYPPVE